MDVTVAPFDDRNVRLALKYARDRDDITEKVFLGEASKGNDTPVAQIMEYHGDVPQYDYSIEKAKEYLREAGLDTLTVDLSTAETAFPGAVEAVTLGVAGTARAGDASHEPMNDQPCSFPFDWMNMGPPLCLGKP